MWLTDGFSVTFFGRWRGQCPHTLIPVWLTCGSRTRNVTCRGGGELQTSKNSESSENFKFLLRWWGALAVILHHMSGSHLELLKMAAT